MARNKPLTEILQKLNEFENAVRNHEETKSGTDFETYFRIRLALIDYLTQ